MNAKTTSRKWSWIPLNERRAATTGMLLLLLLLTLPAVVQAQFNYTDNGDGTATITGYTGPGGDVTIPDTIAGLQVTSIGEWAFENCTSLTSVTIPNSVTNIGMSAFDLCTRLTSVTIANGVVNIGDSAFFECTGLSSVIIPNSVTNIERQAFAFCTSLAAITVDTNNLAYSSVNGVLFNKSTNMLIQCPGGKAGDYTIPSSVTSIGELAFEGCTNLTGAIIGTGVITIGDHAFGFCRSLTSVTIPDSVTSIPDDAFLFCTSLTSVMIGQGVTSIGSETFYHCSSLSSVMISQGVTSIGSRAFYLCSSLTGVYFQGNAPSLDSSDVFGDADNATVYYLPGTTGWDTTFGGLPTALLLLPTIQTSPLTQTAEAGSAVDLWVEASGTSLFCLWYFNYTNLISCSTNCELELTNLQFSQSGAYTAVITNAGGAVTSSPAVLNVIAPVERSPVPGVKLTGQTGSVLNVDYASSLRPTPNWTTLGSVSLVSTSQYYFDLTLPLPPHRYYQAWQTGTPGVMPSLDLHMVPAITLTGNIGNLVRVDAINQFGPTDAWATLDTVTLTNTSQLYFDVSAPGQPQRLYRLVPLP